MPFPKQMLFKIGCASTVLVPVHISLCFSAKLEGVLKFTEELHFYFN